MTAIFLFLSLCLLLLINVQGFVRSTMLPVAIASVKPSIADSNALFACRRNSKLEKRKRNKAYARRFQAVKGGPSRRQVVVEEKRAVVAASEDRFVANLFKFTTDDDMPEYTAFSFS